jgi:hypothetical protein
MYNGRCKQLGLEIARAELEKLGQLMTNGSILILQKTIFSRTAIADSGKALK